MQIHALRDTLRTHGAAPLHEARILRQWLRAKPLHEGRTKAEHFLPQRLRAVLPQLSAQLSGLATLRSAHPAADGSERLLVGLHDGQTVEAVLLPRGGLCVSTQVGCAVACGFCMTGRGGLQRQLGSAEIAAQLVLARARRTVNKVVFMGMGEPALREQLLPKAPRIAPQELVALGDAYARATGYPMQLQWTLLAGVNDGDDELEALVPLLRGRYAMLNLIPYNAVDGLPYARPDAGRAWAMARALCCRGVLTRLRQSAGQEVEGGCGQLRARAVVPVAVAAA